MCFLQGSLGTILTWAWHAESSATDFYGSLPLCGLRILPKVGSRLGIFRGIGNYGFKWWGFLLRDLVSLGTVQEKTIV